MATFRPTLACLQTGRIHTEPDSRTRVELGIAEIGAMVGGLIRQGRPLPVVLTTLCELFNATVKGHSSSVLLLDRIGARVRNAFGSGLPASYMKQLERTWRPPTPSAAKSPRRLKHPKSRGQ